MTDRTIILWTNCYAYNEERMIRELSKSWVPGSIKKFMSISTDCPTAKYLQDYIYFHCSRKKNRFTSRGVDCSWTSYKAYNKQYPMWEYMVLLKLVYKVKLLVRLNPYINRRIFQPR